MILFVSDLLPRVSPEHIKVVFLFLEAKEQVLLKEVHSIYNFILSRCPKMIAFPTNIGINCAIQSKICRFHFISGQYFQFNILPSPSSDGPLHSAEADEKNRIVQVLY